MTTPPRSISALGVLTLLGLGALLVFGSCGVPLPTERDADPRQDLIGTVGPNVATIEVSLDGQVVVNGAPHDIDDVSEVVADLVEAATEPLVTRLHAAADVPYRVMDELQRELVEAGAVRVLFQVEPPPAGSDGPLAIVMPQTLEQAQVSGRNILRLDVQASGQVDVLRPQATSPERIAARAVEELWRRMVVDNPNLIASVRFQPEATYAQVMRVLDALHAANAQRISLWGTPYAQ